MIAAGLIFSFIAVLIPKADSAVLLEEATQELNVFALPVGQGDSTIIQCPRQYGGSLTIVDIGSSKNTGYMTRNDIARYLRGHVIEKIFITHPDRDHANFIDSALSNLEVESYPPIMHSCGWSKYSKYVKTQHLTRNRISHCCGPNCPRYIICNGQVELAVLASEHAGCHRGGKNGDSLIIQVRYSGRKVLLMGDYEGNRGLINNLLSCANGQVESDVYRLSHHGAYNGVANTPNLLNAIRPSYAFSSSGLHSRYKHPRCEIYDILRDGLSTSPGHYYTCYSTQRRRWEYTQVTEAMFVTTVVSTNGNKVINYIVRFSVDSNGMVSHFLQMFNSFTRYY